MKCSSANMLNHLAVFCLFLNSSNKSEWHTSHSNISTAHAHVSGVAVHPLDQSFFNQYLILDKNRTVYFNSCMYFTVALKCDPCKTASVRNWMANKSFREGTEILTALWTFTEIKLFFVDGSWYIIITVRFPTLFADSLTSWPIAVIDLRSLSLVALKCRTHQCIYQECISTVYWNKKVENKHKSVFCTCIIQHLKVIRWAFEFSFTTYTDVIPCATRCSLSFISNKSPQYMISL